MNDPRFSPDDPKLTAYALGELSGDERAAVETVLRQRPELRAVVDDIRATISLLEAALADEAAASATDPRTAVNGSPGGVNGHAAAVPPARPRRRSAPRTADEPAELPRTEIDYSFPRTGAKLIRFPQFYYLAAGLAAACFAVLVALREPPVVVPTPEAERAVWREIALAPPAAVPVALPGIETAAPATSDVRLAGAGSADERRIEDPAGPRPPPVASDPSQPSSPPVRFLDPDLSLLAQTRPERAPGSNVAAAEPLAPASTSEVTSRPAPTTKITLNATAPTPAGQTVGVTMVSSIGPGATTLATTTTVTATPGTSEVVTLSAFVVAEDRGHGFATAGGSARESSGRRGSVERDALPTAPPGAKFGRNVEAYSYIRDNDFLTVAQNQLSTFSIDVDTASYANVRRILAHGSPPPRDAVRIEELLNYFPYRYAAPKGADPFTASLEVAVAPWAPKHKLVRIGLKARELNTAQRPAANLVFLLDVSGSMDQPNKLPLVKQSLQLLIGKLRADDRVAIVTYAGSSGLALASTPVARSREILNALDALTPGGSTNGAMGIQLAYDIAKANFAPNGINRVILCTDGDFNVGTTSEGELVRLIEEKAGSGVFLTVLGFGMGNYKDATLEKLAGKGNGNYGYIDTRREAEKLLVEQVSSTLVTVAKDVKVQVEFNPARVHSYRLIGYENRLLKKEDFNDDKVDAGELGAGDAVTALYEIVPVGAEDKAAAVAPVEALKYAAAARGAVSSRLELPAGGREPSADELLTVKVRYKKPDSLISWPRALDFVLVDAPTPFARASADFRFAAAVAQFGMILRGSPHRGTATMADVGTWAAAASTPQDDPGGYRGEFIELVRKAQTMME
ncbi:YfbK domain-containing protein [Horticoccus sp. 23ND18S-11]|uniref:YfbK domain-containing protein n=1 Tax=Horticoccus sp. 23ND18S-11 TaxID=3391832 RepID=UPI0039C95A1B